MCMITEGNINKIKAWSAKVNAACLDCEAELCELKVQRNTVPTLVQATAIIKWTNVFYAFQMDLGGAIAKRNDGPATQQQEIRKLMTDIERALIYINGILSPFKGPAIERLKLKRAIEILKNPEHSQPKPTQSNKKRHSQYILDILDKDPTLKEYKERAENTLLLTARMDAQSHYQKIKDKHHELDVYLTLLEDGYTEAEKHINEWMKKIHADEAQRADMKIACMKAIGVLVLFPLGLHLLLDPTLQAMNGITSYMGANVRESATASRSQDDKKNMRSTLQSQFFSFVLILGNTLWPTAKNKDALAELDEHGPLALFKMMRLLSDHKLHGVAKKMSQAFDEKTDAWDGHQPKDIIHTMGINCMENNKDLTKELKSLLKNMFDMFNKQYPENNDIEQLAEIINGATIDRRLSGLKSVNSKNRKALVKLVATEIEASIVLQFASIFHEHFGADPNRIEKNIDQISKHSFKPEDNSHFGSRLDRKGIAILDRLITLLPDKKDQLEPLKNVGYFAYYIDPIIDSWNIKPRPEQKNRQNVLNSLIQEYVNTNMSKKLNEVIFKFGLNNNIIPKGTTPSTVQLNFESEMELENKSKALTASLIKDTTELKAFNKNLCNVANEFIQNNTLLRAVNPKPKQRQTME